MPDHEAPREGHPLSPAQRTLLDRALRTLAPALGGIPPAVLNHGRRRRIATATQQRALALRDKGCVWHDCQAPPGWCQAHHYLREWTAGGLTDLDDLALLCPYHHYAVHELGWILTRDPVTLRFSVSPPARRRTQVA